jgi:hypothetical protein
MADSITNQSNVLTNSSVASLEIAVCSGSFLRDVSREHEFNHYLHYVLDQKIYDYEARYQYDLNRWTGFFRFMLNDDGGIMSHISTLMEQEHGRLVHDWKHVDERTHQMEQLIANVQRFRMLCKDFRIQDREYDCFTSNFLVEKPRGLRMDEHPFFMTARMMRKLRILQIRNYSVIELTDKYELLENFLLHDGGHFDDTFNLGSTVVQVKSMNNPSMLRCKTVKIEVESGIFGHSTRLVSHSSHLDCDSTPPPLEVTDLGPGIAEMKLVGRVLSCLKHMSKYKDYEAQFGVIDNLYKVGCDNFIVAKSPTIHEILHMKPHNDLVPVDLSKLSDVPLIFGIGVSTLDGIHWL